MESMKNRNDQVKTSYISQRAHNQARHDPGQQSTSPFHFGESQHRKQSSNQVTGRSFKGSSQGFKDSSHRVAPTSSAHTSRNTQKMMLSEYLQDRDGQINVDANGPAHQAKKIDLRKSVISDEPVRISNQQASQSTTTALQQSLDAGGSSVYDVNKKKIVEQFQMSVMRNELKKGLKIGSSRVEAFDSSLNELDGIKQSLAQGNDSINSSLADNNQTANTLFMQNPIRTINQSNISSTLGGSKTQRNQHDSQQYSMPYPGFSFAMNSSDNNYTVGQMDPSIFKPTLINQSVEVLKQSALPMNHSLDQQHSTGETMRIIERDNILATQRAHRQKVTRGQDPVAQEGIDKGTLSSIKRRSEDSLRSTHSPEPEPHEAAADFSSLKKARGQDVIQSNNKDNTDSLTSLPKIQFRMAGSNAADSLADTQPLQPPSQHRQRQSVGGLTGRLMMSRGNPMKLDEIYSMSVADYNRELLRSQPHSQRMPKRQFRNLLQQHPLLSTSRQPEPQYFSSTMQQPSQRSDGEQETQSTKNKKLEKGQKHQSSAQTKASQPQAYGLHQQQRIKVNKRIRDWNYEPKANEFTEDMLNMSGGNKYHQSTSGHLNKFINGLQGNIVYTNEAKAKLRGHSQKIFDIMKHEKKKYLKTLIKGETEGHCKGISKRLDETAKIRMINEVEKQRQAWEAKKVIVKAMQAQKEEERDKARKKRVQDKLAALDERSNVTKYMFLNQKNKKLDKVQAYDWLNNKAKGVSMPGRQIRSSILTSHETFDSGTMNTTRERGRERKVHINISDVGQLDADHGLPVMTAASGEFNIGADPKANIQSAEYTQEFEKDQQHKMRLSSTHAAGEQGVLSSRHSSHRRESVRIGFEGQVLSTQGGHSKCSFTTSQPFTKAKLLINGLKLKQAIAGLTRIQQGTQTLQVNAPANMPANFNIDKMHDFLSKMEEDIQEDDQSLFAKMHNHFKKEQQYAQRASSSMSLAQRDHTTLVRDKIRELQLDQDQNVTDLFRSMSLQETNISKRSALMNREALKQFLEDRYSKLVGQKLMIFLETQLHQMHRAHHETFVQMITDMLQGGPEFYKKMCFACLSLSRNGRICEHDMFTIMEQFKQRDSFFFYKELIQQPDVPRDYKNAYDQSDQLFYNAFVKDMKLISHMINLRKRMAGLVDMDTIEDVADDFDEERYPGASEQYEFDLMNQIQYIISIINKKGGGLLQIEMLDVFLEAKNLRDLRNELCGFVAKNKLVQKQVQKRQNSVSQKAQQMDKKMGGDGGQGGHKPSNIDFFTPPAYSKPCIGATGKEHKKIYECVYITYEDFSKLFCTKRGAHVSDVHISSLAEDLISVFTQGRIDLTKYETELAPLRELEEKAQSLQTASKLAKQETKRQSNQQVQSQTTQSSGFQTQKTEMDKGQQKRRSVTNQQHDKKMSVTAGSQAQKEDIANSGFGKQNEEDEKNSGRKFRQIWHRVTEPYIDQDQPAFQGEFQGKFLILKKKEDTDEKEKHGKKGHAGVNSSALSDINSLSKEDPDEKKSLIISLHKETIIKLFRLKFQLGLENFFNIFHCFYMLSKIPKNAQNNPFALYMDEESVLRGFKATFGIYQEEIAVRFYRLFLLPPSETANKKRMKSVDLLRFYDVVIELIDKSNYGESQIRNAFKFYDFDESQSIGSVDIVNLIKDLPQKKTEKIFKKHNAQYQERLNEAKREQERQAAARARKKCMQTQANLQLESLFKQQSSADSPPPRISEAQLIRDDHISDGTSSEEEESTAEELDVTTQSQTADKAQPEEPADSKETAQMYLSKLGRNLSGRMDSRAQQNRTPRRGLAHLTSPVAAWCLENHSQSKSIRNPWNCFLLETKVLRDYFVDEVVPSQGSKASDPNFFTFSKFQARFIPMVEERYKIAAPAICHFFRCRFIVSQTMPEQQFGYYLERQSNKSIGQYIQKISDTKLDMSQTVREIGLPQHQLSSATIQMMQMLNNISIVPRGLYLIDTTEFEPLGAVAGTVSTETK